MQIDGKYVKVVHNESEDRFEAVVGPWMARIDYKLRGGTIHLIHTEVPEALQGAGVGAKLARKSIRLAAEKGYEIHIWCPFLKRYFQKHPEALQGIPVVIR